MQGGIPHEPRRLRDASEGDVLHHLQNLPLVRAGQNVPGRGSVYQVRTNVDLVQRDLDQQGKSGHVQVFIFKHLNVSN